MGYQAYLVVSEPDLRIQHRKRQHMIDERLCLPRRRRHPEYLPPHQTLTPSCIASQCAHAGEREMLTWVNTSFVSRPHSVSSNPASKLRIPRLPFRQFPLILSSSIVCTFCT